MPTTARLWIASTLATAASSSACNTARAAHQRFDERTPPLRFRLRLKENSFNGETSPAARSNALKCVSLGVSEHRDADWRKHGEPSFDPARLARQHEPASQ